MKRPLSILIVMLMVPFSLSRPQISESQANSSTTDVAASPTADAVTTGDYVSRTVASKIAQWNEMRAAVESSIDRNDPEITKATNILSGHDYQGQTVSPEMANDAVISGEIASRMPAIPDQWMNVSIEHLAQIVAKSIQPTFSGDNTDTILTTSQKTFDNGDQGYQLFIPLSTQSPSFYTYYSPDNSEKPTDTDENNLVHSISIVLDSEQISNTDYLAVATRFISLLTTQNKESEGADIDKRIIDQLTAKTLKLDEIDQQFSKISFSTDGRFVIMTFTPTDNPIVRPDSSNN